MKIVAVACIFSQWISGIGTIVAAQPRGVSRHREKKAEGKKRFKTPPPSTSFRLASHRIGLYRTETNQCSASSTNRDQATTSRGSTMNAKLLLSPVVLMVTLLLLLMLLLPLTPHIAAISAARASAAAFLRSSLRSFFCFALSLRASACGRQEQKRCNASSSGGRRGDGRVGEVAKY